MSTAVNNDSCAACGLAPRNGVEPACTPSCSQVYCWECLVQRPTCGCGKPIQIEKVRPVDGRRVKCPNPNCGVLVRPCALALHELSCPEALVPCPLSPACGRISRSQLAEHHANQCPHRQLSCPQGCGASRLAKRMQAHVEAECANTAAPCDCGTEVRRCDINAHRRVCPQQPEDCPFVPLGCPARATKREQLAAHANEAAAQHFALIAHTLQDQGRRLARLEPASPSSACRGPPAPIALLAGALMLVVIMATSRAPFACAICVFLTVLLCCRWDQHKHRAAAGAACPPAAPPGAAPAAPPLKKYCL